MVWEAADYSERFFRDSVLNSQVGLVFITTTRQITQAVVRLGQKTNQRQEGGFKTDYYSNSCPFSVDYFVTSPTPTKKTTTTKHLFL